MSCGPLPPNPPTPHCSLCSHCSHCNHPHPTHPNPPLQPLAELVPACEVLAQKHAHPGLAPSFQFLNRIRSAAREDNSTTRHPAGHRRCLSVGWTPVSPAGKFMFPP